MVKKAAKSKHVPVREVEPFDRAKHVYTNGAFVELVKDAIRFFNGTPVHSLPPPERFLGTGVYALYYTGNAKPYSKYAELNRLAYDFPIYVGKAVPKGWRQSRRIDSVEKQSSELFSRLKQHSRSIEVVSGLRLEDFTCRFMIFEGASSDMIGTLEAFMIKWKKPLWNSARRSSRRVLLCLNPLLSGHAISLPLEFAVNTLPSIPSCRRAVSGLDSEPRMQNPPLPRRPEHAHLCPCHQYVPRNRRALCPLATSTIPCPMEFQPGPLLLPPASVAFGDDMKSRFCSFASHLPPA